MYAEMSFLIAYRPPAVTPGSNPMGGRVNPTASTTTNSPLTTTATSPTTGSCPPCKRPIGTSGWTSSPSAGPGSAWAWGTTPGPTTPCTKPSVNTGPEVKGGGPIPPKVNRGSSWEENHPLYPPSHAYLPPLPMPSGRPKVMWASYPRRGILTGTTWGLKTPDIGIVATVSALFDSHSGFSYQTSAEAVPKSCNVSTIFHFSKTYLTRKAVILIFGFDDLANTKVQQQIFKLFCFRLKAWNSKQ